MIEIISTKQLVDSMKLAQETNTEEQLIRWLLWLDSFNDHKNVIVEILQDIPMNPGFICWYAYRVIDGKKETAPFYNGGLVYHKNSNEWSVHS